MAEAVATLRVGLISHPLPPFADGWPVIGILLIFEYYVYAAAKANKATDARGTGPEDPLILNILAVIVRTRLNRHHGLVHVWPNPGLQNVEDCPRSCCCPGKPTAFSEYRV
jgi:hypothetical protein